MRRIAKLKAYPKAKEGKSLESRESFPSPDSQSSRISELCRLDVDLSDIPGLRGFGQRDGQNALGELRLDLVSLEPLSSVKLLPTPTPLRVQ